MAGKERRGAAADVAAAAAKVPPPPLPLPPNLTVAQLPKLLRPTGRRFQAARGPDPAVQANEEAVQGASETNAEVTQPVTERDGNGAAGSSPSREPVAESREDVGPASACGPQHSPEAPGSSPSTLNREEDEHFVRDPLHPETIQVASGDAAALAAQAAPEIHLADQAGLGTTDVEPPREVTPDFQLAEAVSHILSDVGALSTECSRMFKDSCTPGEAELLDAEQLHKLTQMLIDRFGCTSPATLDRIGHVYVAATSGRLEQGLAELEFRGYVAAVLTQILQDLERRSSTEDTASDGAGGDAEPDSGGMMESLQGVRFVLELKLVSRDSPLLLHGILPCILDLVLCIRGTCRRLAGAADVVICVKSPEGCELEASPVVVCFARSVFGVSLNRGETVDTKTVTKSLCGGSYDREKTRSAHVYIVSSTSWKGMAGKAIAGGLCDVRGYLQQTVHQVHSSGELQRVLRKEKKETEAERKVVRKPSEIQAEDPPEKKQSSSGSRNRDVELQARVSAREGSQIVRRFSNASELDKAPQAPPPVPEAAAEESRFDPLVWLSDCLKQSASGDASFRDQIRERVIQQIKAAEADVVGHLSWYLERRLLRAGAEDFLDAEEDDQPQQEIEAGRKADWLHEPDCLEVGDDSADAVEAPLKRQRIQAMEPPGEDEAQAESDDGFDFEFEADLQKATARSGAAVGSGMLSEDGLSCTQLVAAGPGLCSAAGPAPGTTSSQYVYNTRTQRWESGTQFRMPKDARRVQGSGPRRKVKLCRFFAISGFCRWGNSCYFAHGEAELALGGDAVSQQQIISECSSRAWDDAEGGCCSYAQALAVRLALRFEAQPEHLLPTMEKTGLPTSGDGARAAVKMLLRLCHPDKCGHPEAKKAVQILGPLLAKCSS
ncbi:unnamed protein product [Symbiodinium sp. KB8]|nr:unnamed protein product [Symbiodinium sp. KB8]